MGGLCGAWRTRARAEPDSTDYSTWGHLPLTTDTNSWYFVSSAITMALFAAVAVYGFVVSLGRRLGLDDPLAEL